MADTQLDRIEAMLKIVLQATTTVTLDGSVEDGTDLRNKVKKYKIKKE